MSRKWNAKRLLRKCGMGGAVGYEGRVGVLRKMGYASFDEYLASTRWLVVRKQAFTANGLVCKLCRRNADVIHFRQYSAKVLLGRDLPSLIPVCERCSTILHANKRGVKRTFEDTARKYARMWSKSPANPEVFTRVKRGRGMNAAEFLELKDVKGRCRTCGKKARKGTLYCRPHARDVLVAR